MYAQTYMYKTSMIKCGGTCHLVHGKQKEEYCF